MNICLSLGQFADPSPEKPRNKAERNQLTRKIEQINYRIEGFSNWPLLPEKTR